MEDGDGNGVVLTNAFGDVCIRKARRKRQKLLVRELMYDYANNTTLHGLPYVTRPGRTTVEKTFWLITFLISIIICFFSISQVWIKWRESPVIVTVNEKQVSVRMVPFPSVTICPQSKCLATKYNYTAEKSAIEDFLESYKGSNDNLNSTMKKRIEKVAALKQICSESRYDWFHRLYPYKNYSDYSIFKRIRNVAPSYGDIFAGCIVRDKEQLCQSIFNEVVTKEGICYNMNSLAASEIFRSNQLQTHYKYLHAKKPSKGWLIEDGHYKRNSTYNFPRSFYYPMPGAENLASPDLEIILLNNLTDRDVLCNGRYSGYKVYVQHPADFPQSSQHYYSVLNGQVSSMALSFNQLSSSDRLKTYDIEVRQCYFPGEKYLKYFNHYTENNCRLECLTNITFKSCRCVKFYMPHNSGAICTVKKEKCVKNALEIFQYQESDRSTAICRCLPPCNSVEYEAEILKTDYNLASFLKIYYNITVRANYSKLDIYFKKPRFLSMRRSEVFGTINFFANCGGLLGLFLGFSFLSLIEIFYFLTLRLYFTLMNDLKEEKARNQTENVVHEEKY